MSEKTSAGVGGGRSGGKRVKHNNKEKINFNAEIMSQIKSNED